VVGVGQATLKFAAGDDYARVSAATRNCPVTATKVPAGGHEFCPVAVTGSARM
jgi:hypothetical protein